MPAAAVAVAVAAVAETRPAPPERADDTETAAEPPRGTEDGNTSDEGLTLGNGSLSTTILNTRPITTTTPRSQLPPIRPPVPPRPTEPGVAAAATERWKPRMAMIRSTRSSSRAPEASSAMAAASTASRPRRRCFRRTRAAPRSFVRTPLPILPPPAPTPALPPRRPLPPVVVLVLVGGGDVVAWLAAPRLALVPDLRGDSSEETVAAAAAEDGRLRRSVARWSSVPSRFLGGSMPSR